MRLSQKHAKSSSDCYKESIVSCVKIVLLNLSAKTQSLILLETLKIVDEIVIPSTIKAVSAKAQNDLPQIYTSDLSIGQLFVVVVKLLECWEVSRPTDASGPIRSFVIKTSTYHSRGNAFKHVVIPRP